MSTEIVVYSEAELASAYKTLSESTGGTISIASGANISAITLSGGGSSNVTITSADSEAPTAISQIHLSNASNIDFENMLISSDSGQQLRIFNSENISIRSSEFASDATVQLVDSLAGTNAQGADIGIVRDSSGITIEQNDLHGFFRGITFFDTTNIRVANNEFHEFQGDGLRFEGAKGVDILDNHFYDYLGAVQSVNHADFIQVWSVSGTDVVTGNMLISGNVMNTGSGSGAQGIFINNEAFSSTGNYYSNINVTNNVIYSAMWNGIRVNGTDGVTITQNTLLWNKDARVVDDDGSVYSAPPAIRADNTLNAFVSDNIAVKITVNGEEQSDNIKLNYKNASWLDYAYDYFPGLLLGGDASLADLQAAAGSQAAETGALLTRSGADASALGVGEDATLEDTSVPTAQEPEESTTQEPLEDGGFEQSDSVASTDLAVNTGGELLTFDGTSWLADSFATGGRSFKISAPISGTNADALYQTERYGDFSYAFAVENGDYEVTLKFAEIYFDREGKRIFDVFAEGSKTIDDLDIYAEVGKNAAYDVTVPISVRDGQLDLRFESEVNNAKISGIAITRMEADGSETGESADAPSSEVSAPFDLSGSNLGIGDVFLFGFGVDGKSAPMRQSGGEIGVDNAGSATEIDYRKGSAAGSEVVGFDFGEAGAKGIALDLDGMNTVKGAKEGAFFRTYDAAGAMVDEWLLTSNMPETLEFSEAVRFATLESSPWITDGSWPSQEPDFSLQNFDIF